MTRKAAVLLLGMLALTSCSQSEPGEENRLGLRYSEEAVAAMRAAEVVETYVLAGPDTIAGQVVLGLEVPEGERGDQSKWLLVGDEGMGYRIDARARDLTQSEKEDLLSLLLSPSSYVDDPPRCVLTPHYVFRFRAKSRMINVLLGVPCGIVRAVTETGEGAGGGWAEPVRNQLRSLLGEVFEVADGEGA